MTEEPSAPDLSDLAAALVEAERSGPPGPAAAEAPPHPPPSGPRRLLRGTVPRPLFAAVTAALVAATAVFAVLWWRAGAPGRAEGAVLEVARRFATSLVTFDYRTIDADVRRIQADFTGNFHRELTTALGGGVGIFKDALVQSEARSRGRVRRAYVTSVTGSTATALVLVDQTITNKESKEPQTVSRRLELTLVRTREGWKVDSVEAS